MNKLSKKTWTTIILFGLIGQIAWSIENNEFNLFLFNYIGGSTSDIARMVAYSAIAATLTTLFMGTLSDKIGHRKLFLCVGYILWGISTLAFAFISRDNVARFVSEEKILSTTASLVVLMDCVMTFFGSTANDASFNSWVTENTEESNRTKVEGILNTFPLISMLIVAGASNIIIELTGWPIYFIAIGLIVIVCGVLGLFFVEDSKTIISDNEGFINSLFYGFKLEVIKENKLFYISLIALCIFNIATQIYMPYLLIYLNKTLGYDVLTYSIVMAIVILVACIVAVIFSGKIDNFGRRKAMNISIAIYALGLVLVYFVSSPILFTIIGSIMMIGFVFISVILMSTIRDYTPAKHVGNFQGIRLFMYVLVPMIIGPGIGDFLINKLSSGTYVNDYNELVSLPVKEIFVVAGIVVLLIYIPCKKLFKK